MLHEQMIRQNYATTKGLENRASSAADARSSPDRKSNNFVGVGGGLMPDYGASGPTGSIHGSMEMSRMSERESGAMDKTFQEKNSPIHKAMRNPSNENLHG